MIYKDPDAMLTYSFTWPASRLGGGEIATSTWAASAGLTVIASSHNGVTTTVKIAGGGHRQTYILCNRVTTTTGEEDIHRVGVRVRRA